MRKLFNRISTHIKIKLFGSKPNLPQKMLFDGFKVSRDNSVGLKQSVNKRYYDIHAHKTIHGWLTPIERQCLYSLSNTLKGPFLELGAWAGLSTTAIAKGIIESENPAIFDTVEFAPTQDNFKLVDGKIGFFMENELNPRGTCSTLWPLRQRLILSSQWTMTTTTLPNE